MRRLLAAQPTNLEWLADLAAYLNRIGDALFATGDGTRAPAAYEEAMAVARQLVAAEPANVRAERDLSIGLYKVGDARLATGDRAGAFAVFEESLAPIRKLAASDPGNVFWQTDLVVSPLQGEHRRRAPPRPRLPARGDRHP